MEINDEIKKCFKDHKAHFRDLGEVKILDWKKDNTICQSIRYVFDGSKLYVSGDYGCAVFWLTWKGTPESFENDMSLGYFYEKMQAYEGDLYNQPDDCKYLYYYINRSHLLPYVYIIPRFNVENNRNWKKIL